MRRSSHHDVDQDRKEGSVEADDRLDRGQHCVRHSLRYVHDGHGESGHEVCDEVVSPPVLGQPLGDGERRTSHVEATLGGVFGVGELATAAEDEGVHLA